MNLTLFLIFGFIGIMVGSIHLVSFIQNKSWFPKWLYSFFDRNGAGVLMIFAVFLLAFGLYKYNVYESKILYYEEEHEYYIYSLGNESEISGDFFLGTGDISSTQYYFFYVNYTKGMFREKIPAHKSYIIEGDYDRPYVSRIMRKYDDQDRFFKIFDDVEADHYKIYVPHGTIIRDFRVR